MKTNKENLSVYLDYAASTPTDPRVLEAMLPYFSGFYGNPGAKHPQGKAALQAVENARSQISEALNALACGQTVFTSGATEAINLAVRGAVEAYSAKGSHIVALQTEHKAVLDTCRYLETIGCSVSLLAVNNDGLIDLDDLAQAIRPDTVLVCAIWANNETGVLQDMDGIARICKEKRTLLFSDATQAFGKIPIDLEKTPIDLLAFSGHKIYGPKGIGGLFVRKGIHLAPILYGGGQENGLRPGTPNVPGIVGLGEAARLAFDCMPEESRRISKLRDVFEATLLASGLVSVNGGKAPRLPNISNLLFNVPNAEGLIDRLPLLALSQGSACNASLFEPSHVLKAMGLSDEEAFASLRFSFGRQTMGEEVERAVGMVRGVMSEK